jgi:hypothetical protein
MFDRYGPLEVVPDAVLQVHQEPEQQGRAEGPMMGASKKRWQA